MLLGANTSEYKNIIVQNVKVPAIVIWSLKMLSEQLVKKEYCVNRNEGMAQIHTIDPILKNISSMPLILKTVLMIEEDFVRIQILESPIIKQSLLNINLIDDCVVSMLSNDHTNSVRSHGH